MADRYWVGGTGNWSDNTNHWSATDGGSPGASLPTASDNVNFTNLSSAANAAYTVTLDASVDKVCLDFNMAGPGGGNKVTWAGSQQLTISGSMNLSGGTAGITRTYTGALIFNATTTGKTVTFNSVVLASATTFDGAGGGWTFQDAFNIGTQTLTLSNGTLDTNGKAGTSGTFLSTSGTRTLTLGATAWSASNWSVNSGLTLNANTSAITVTSTVFNGGGLTYNDVTLTNASFSTFTGANTFHNLTFPSGNGQNVPANGSNPAIGANQTVNGTLSATGTLPGQFAILASDTYGTARTITAAAVSLTNVIFQDITGAGAAAPFTGTRLGDAGGNSGISFTTGVNKFYVGNTNNWNATNVWATSSGGAGADNNFPLPQDTAVFDGSSFSANGQTLTIGNDVCLPAINFSAITKTITFACGSGRVPEFYGNLTLSANVTMSGTGRFLAASRGAQTITSTGVAWTQDFTVKTIGGTVSLSDAFTTGSARTFTLTNGTLDLNTKTLTTGRFSSSNSNTRALTFGTGGKIVVNDTTAATVFDATTTTNLTVTRTGGAIDVGGNTTNVRTINLGASKSWPTITFTNTTAAGGLDIVSSGTATVVQSFAYTGGTAQTIRRTASTTISVETDTTGFFSGTSGNVITLGSITAASHTWTKTGGGIISSDYLSISRSTATPGSTWYAGANSTDGGNNSGWTFSIPSTNITPTTGALVLTGNAPDIRAPISPTTGTLALTGVAPVTVQGTWRAPTAGGLTLTGAAPALLQGTVVVPTAGGLTLTGVAPSWIYTLTPTTGTLTTTGVASSLVRGTVVNPTEGSLTLTGVAPRWVYTLTPDTGGLTLTGAASTVVTGTLRTPTVGGLTFTGVAPAPVRGTVISPTEGTLTTTGVAPRWIYTLTPDTGNLITAGVAPRWIYTLTPGTGGLTFTGVAPAPVQSVVRTPTAVALTLTGVAPRPVQSTVLTPTEGTLIFTGYAPDIEKSFVEVTGVSAVGRVRVVSVWVGVYDAQTPNWADVLT